MVPAALTIVILLLTSLQNKGIDANVRKRDQKQGATLRTDTNFEKEGNHHLKRNSRQNLQKSHHECEKSVDKGFVKFAVTCKANFSRINGKINKLMEIYVSMISYIIWNFSLELLP